MGDDITSGAAAVAVPSSAPTLEEVRGHRAELVALASRSGITAIGVFGSVARGDSTGDSDVDFVVDARPDVSYFSLASFALEAEAVLGHPVDVVFRSGLQSGRDDAVVLDEVPL